MPKDKYESPNPRRSYTLMSQEDVANGKKSSYHELEISGNIRNLSPQLWTMHHLTALFLNDNNLTRLPPAISHLSNLVYLDLSCNKIRSLPAELGDLIHMRELLLGHNHIRVLPFEIGRLFQLQTLGLKGNPLSPEFQGIYNEPNGITKLLAYMLDNLHGFKSSFCMSIESSPQRAGSEPSPPSVSAQRCSTPTDGLTPRPRFATRRRRVPPHTKTETVSMATLEVVSAENFQRRLEGISGIASPCADCQRERARDLPRPSMEQGFTTRRRKGSRMRLNSPIVVPLQDTLKATRVSAKCGTKLRNKSVDIDSDMSSDDGLPPNQETSLKTQQLQALKCLRDGKNFNAFLSAIERVHQKDHGSLTSANLQQYLRCFKDSGQMALLNNALQAHIGNSRSRSLDKHKVALICNDLQSKDLSAESEDTSEDSERSSIISSSEELPSDSDLSSSTDSTADELSPMEVRSLTHYTTGYSVTKYHCSPQDCPECLASAYATDSESDSSCEGCEAEHNAGPSFEVTVTGQGKVEVSVGALHSPRQRRRRQQNRSYSNSVYVDLTHSDISLSIQYHQGVSTAPSRHHAALAPTPQDWYTAYPYGGILGYVPMPYPYYMMPMYYTYPPLSMPKPLCVPRSTACLASQRLCMVPAPQVKQFTASQPPQRPWLPLQNADTNQPVATYTVMCYNVLCDKYATRQLYGYCPTWALGWEYRKKGIIEEIRHYSADIITLQEIETDQFYKFFLPELKRDGYDGIFSPKSRARTMTESERKHVDGCAIFFRTSKFSVIKEHLIEFNQLAMASAEGSHDMLNRVMTKDNIGLAALFETKEEIWQNGLPQEHLIRQPILVATCHVHWDPEFSDVKLIQTMMLMSELQNIRDESQITLRPRGASERHPIPLLLCGDLNSLPDSGVVEYLLSGRVSANHGDFKDLGYDSCLQKLSNADNRDEFTHGFKLSAAYEKDAMPYTNYTFDFKGVIDYVFYSRDAMSPLGVLGPLDSEWFVQNKVLGCPHPHVPSDHLPLLVEFQMKPLMQGNMQAQTAGNANNSSRSTGMHLASRR